MMCSPLGPGRTALLLLTLSPIAGCKAKVGDTAASSPAAAVAAATTPAVAAATPSVPIDELVAPIALYPDQLLGQILTISTTPQEVLDVGNWLLDNQGLKDDALTAAAKQAGFTPSAQYLVLFPQVVDNMCQELEWTTQLGEAFTADQQGVMDAVQRKRQQAQAVGNLQSSPQMTVSTSQANGASYIEVAPADPKIVYVPQYNPEVVYTTPPPSTATVMVQEKSGVSTGAAVGIGLLSFGVGMAVGAAINDGPDYYPYPSWGYGSVYYGGRPYYPPPYRAPVYPGYRPVYGYNPPSNYRWNQYNKQTNITINNNNYYNKFNNTQNRPNRPGNTRPGNANRPGSNNGPLAGSNGNDRPGAGVGNKPQGTYQGARPKTGDQRPGAGMANANPGRPNPGANNRPGANGGSNQVATRDKARPGAGAGNAARPGTRPAAGAAPVNRAGDRGYGDAKPAAGVARPAPATSRPNAGGARPASQAPNRPAPQAQSRPAPRPSGGGAYGSAGGGSGNSARQASSRGKASMGSGGGGGGSRGAGRSR